MTATVCIVGCTKPDEPNNGGNEPAIELPQVTTSEVTDITSTTAVVGGTVVDSGGGTITECGVCWTTGTEPTIDDNYAVAQSIAESFTLTLDSLSANTAYSVRAYAKNEAGIGYGEVLTFTTLSGGSGGDHDYVDLGLPSGLLWATCNVGADSPEGYGDYFAWGETQPKDTYNWSTYQYFNGSNGTLTKYCNDASYGYNGFTDDLTTLLPEDDAATANWGGDWRMPTEAEWQELLDNTTVTWTQQNGVNGRLFTASNGNSLFLPAAGSRWDGELYDVGFYGYYRLSSLLTVNPLYAWYLNFNSGGCYMGSYYRSGGFSVRPVREN